MGGFEGGLPHPLMTLGPGDRALLLGGGSCATAVPAHPERIPVRVAGDIPDPWGHQKGTPDPADMRGERGDPLSRAWPVGYPGTPQPPLVTLLEAVSWHRPRLCPRHLPLPPTWGRAMPPGSWQGPRSQEGFGEVSASPMEVCSRGGAAGTGRVGQTAGQLRQASPVPRGVGGTQRTASTKPHLPAARCWKAPGTRGDFCQMLTKCW